MVTAFSENLKNTRKANGFTQKQVAQALNIEEYVYANWEQGRAEPSIEFIQNLCVILDISANDLLGIEVDKNIRIANSFNNNNGTIGHIVVGNNNHIKSKK